MKLCAYRRLVPYIRDVIVKRLADHAVIEQSSPLRGRCASLTSLITGTVRTDSLIFLYYSFHVHGPSSSSLYLCIYKGHEDENE